MQDNPSDNRSSRDTIARPVTADTRNNDAALGKKTVSENGAEYPHGKVSYGLDERASFNWMDESIGLNEFRSAPDLPVDNTHGRNHSGGASGQDDDPDVHGMIESIIEDNKRKKRNAQSLKKQTAKKDPDQDIASGSKKPVKNDNKTVKDAKKQSAGKRQASDGKKPAQDKKPENASEKQGAAGKKPTSVKVSGNPKQSGKKINDGNKAAAGGKKASSKKKKKELPKVKRKVGFFRGLFRLLIVMIIAGGITAASYVAYTISNAPPIHPDKIYSTLDVTTHIYDDKGKLVDEIFYSENRQIVEYEELPEDLKNAFIAVEDKTFWTHSGFNFKRIIGAVIESFKGGRISGTSTITQQLARNVFLPEDKSIRSIKRKIIEMYYAYEIEQALTKEEILTAYLNTIYLGYGCYGVDTASRKFFSKHVSDLTLAESAALAALPQAPGLYSLIVTEKGDDTTKIRKGIYANDTSADRRYMILDMMADQGYITAEEAEEAKIPLKEYINPSKESETSKSAFKDYLIQTITSDLMEQYDMTEDEATHMIYAKGLNIYSTMNTKAQKIIAKEFADDSNYPTTVKKGTPVESAMVITEVGTGKVKAMVGTRNPDGQKLFNRATNPRQPGSSIKPLSVYSPALQKSYEYQQKNQLFQYVDKGYDKQGKKGWGKYITVSSTVTDEKMTVNGMTWPLNYSRTYTGWNNFRTALQKSINTCAIKILVQVGVDYSMDMLKKFGITSAVDDTSEPYNDVNLAALGLGAMTVGISPLEMSAAYAVFPNGGEYNSPICYTKVEDRHGNVILKGKSKTHEVMNEGVAWIMTNTLQSVVTNGIAGDAAISGVSVGGKTGTTNDVYDIWFNGFTPTYAASLWIGTDKNVEMITDSTTASKLWSKIMDQLQKAKEGSYPYIPSNVIAKNGQYYTAGTQPDDPPPQTKKKDSDKSDKKDGSSQKSDKSDSKKEKE